MKNSKSPKGKPRRIENLRVMEVTTTGSPVNQGRVVLRSDNKSFIIDPNAEAGDEEDDVANMAAAAEKTTVKKAAKIARSEAELDANFDADDEESSATPESAATNSSANPAETLVVEADETTDTDADDAAAILGEEAVGEPAKKVEGFNLAEEILSFSSAFEEVAEDPTDVRRVEKAVTRLERLSSDAGKEALSSIPSQGRSIRKAFASAAMESLSVIGESRGELFVTGRALLKSIVAAAGGEPSTAAPKLTFSERLAAVRKSLGTIRDTGGAQVKPPQIQSQSRDAAAPSNDSEFSFDWASDDLMETK